MTTDEPRQDPLQQRVPLAPPVFAPPLAPAQPAVPLPTQTAPPALPSRPASPGKRNIAVIVLAIACSVLLLSTIGLGVSTALLIQGGSASTPHPTPDPTSTSQGTSAGSTTTEVQDYPVTVASDLRVDHFALASDSSISTLYALVTNTSSNQVARSSFDITAYDADGRIIYRTLDLFYLLPDQTTVLDASFLTVLDELDHFVVEQLDIEWIDPPLSGGATIVEARTGDGHAEADLASTLSAAAEYTEVYLAVFVDDELIGICSDLTDFPANGGTLKVSCGLDPAYDKTEVDVEDLPSNAKLDVLLKIDYTFGE